MANVIFFSETFSTDDYVTCQLDYVGESGFGVAKLTKSKPQHQDDDAMPIECLLPGETICALQNAPAKSINDYRQAD